MQEHENCPAMSFADAYRCCSPGCPNEIGYYVRTDDTAERIISDMKTAERFSKILLIGQSGCGKSFVLRKILADPGINATHHPIFVSAAEGMSTEDAEPIDFLIYLRTKLIQTMQKQNIEVPIKSPDFLASGRELKHKFMKRTQELEDHISDLCWALSGQVHSGYKLDDSVLKKLGDEDISENILSRLGTLKNQEYKSEFTFLRALESVIGELQTRHYKPVFLRHGWVEEKKEVLILTDDMNLLERDVAEKLFSEGKSMIHTLDAKMIFAFPLSLWHYPTFSDIGSFFRCEWLRPLCMYDAYDNYQASHADILKDIVLKRADHSLIAEKALNMLAEISGGIPGELMRSMRAACIRAIRDKAPMIDENIAYQVIHDRIDMFARLTDIAKYENTIKTIIRSKKKTDAQKKDTIDLLSYSYILEYGNAEKLWYDAHPCLTFDGKQQ